MHDDHRDDLIIIAIDAPRRDPVSDCGPSTDGDQSMIVL